MASNPERLIVKLNSWIFLVTLEKHISAPEIRPDFSLKESLDLCVRSVETPIV